MSYVIFGQTSLFNLLYLTLLICLFSADSPWSVHTLWLEGMIIIIDGTVWAVQGTYCKVLQGYLSAEWVQMTISGIYWNCWTCNFKEEVRNMRSCSYPILQIL